MVVPDNIKKRKKDGMDLDETIQAKGVCSTEGSPSKTLKLAHLNLDGNTLPEESQGTQSEESQGSQSDNSQEDNDHALKDSVSRNQQGGSPSLLSHLPQQQRETDCFREGQSPLKLDPGYVFTRLLLAFSQIKLPDKVIYGGKGYNVAAAYDEFWKTFYNSQYYSRGYGVKIPNVQSLIELELKSLVKILKRGWEDERYWPKELSRPFLESCLFKDFSTDSIKPKMLLKFIEPSDRQLIKDQSTVDQNVLDVLKKYCLANTIFIGDDTKGSFIKAAHEIMVVNMKPVIDIWRNEVADLMPKSTFDFLMKPTPIHHMVNHWDDMLDYSAPHELWQTFFLGWPEDKVEYYFGLLANRKYASNCNLCGEWCNAKHFISACDDLLTTLRSERHDAVLKKLLKQVDLAIERKGPYFGRGNDWKVLTSFQNVPYNWPEEMKTLETTHKYPHIVVYSLSPERRALIIEHSVSWEYWMDLQKEKKTQYYFIIKELLEEIGFEVEYQVIVLGSRGVLQPDLYNLFEQIFGMKHSEISMTLEEISQEILNIPYQSEYYKELMNMV